MAGLDSPFHREVWKAGGRGVVVMVWPWHHESRGGIPQDGAGQARTFPNLKMGLPIRPASQLPRVSLQEALREEDAVLPGESWAAETEPVEEKSCVAKSRSAQDSSEVVAFPSAEQERPKRSTRQLPGMTRGKLDRLTLFIYFFSLTEEAAKATGFMWYLSWGMAQPVRPRLPFSAALPSSGPLVYCGPKFEAKLPGFSQEVPVNVLPSPRLKAAFG